MLERAGTTYRGHMDSSYKQEDSKSVRAVQYRPVLRSNELEVVGLRRCKPDARPFVCRYWGEVGRSGGGTGSLSEQETGGAGASERALAQQRPRHDTDAMKQAGNL